MKTPLDAKGVVHIGPFSLWRYSPLSVYISYRDGEGGCFPLYRFQGEVCMWDEVEKADEEKVKDFYSKYF